MHQEWTDKLSDYLDEELTAAERAAVEQHLHECSACAAVLSDLKRVVARAQGIESRPPQVDLWPGIAARIDGGGRRTSPLWFRPLASRRFAFTLPQLAAASLLIAAVSGGLVWSLADRSAKASRYAPPQAPVAAQQSSEQEPSGEPFQNETVSLADAQYDAAVADLEQALKQGRGRLDAATIAIVEHNLQTIDAAIRQAREALAADPANTYLSGHLVEARRRKLDLLRRAAALTSEMD